MCNPTLPVATWATHHRTIRYTAYLVGVYDINVETVVCDIDIETVVFDINIKTTVCNIDIETVVYDNNINRCRLVLRNDTVALQKVNYKAYCDEG